MARDRGPSLQPARSDRAKAAVIAEPTLVTIARMGWEDDPELSGGPNRPVPHPEDRLWRHPSEVASEVGLHPAAPTNHRRGVGTAALAGACLAGAVMAVGAMWVARPGMVIERVPVGLAAATTVPLAVPTSTRASFAANTVATEELAVALTPTMARVETERDGTWTTSSGVWVDDRGTLAVAAPAVQGASRLRVVDHRGEARDGVLIGTDEATGIAVVEVASARGKPAKAADHSASAGEPAAVAGAVGTDAGGGSQATLAGVIVRSAGVRATVGELLLHDTVQLDRPLPADSVGGALVDADGGLLAMVVGNSTERDLATAVPAVEALSTARDLRDQGQVRRAWLGVQAVDLSPDEARTLNVGGGARLTEVTPSSPAAAAGLKVGDVVTAVGSHPVDDSSDLVVALRRLGPGEDVAVKVQHPTGASYVPVTLGG